MQKNHSIGSATLLDWAFATIQKGPPESAQYSQPQLDTGLLGGRCVEWKLFLDCDIKKSLTQNIRQRKFVKLVGITQRQWMISLAIIICFSVNVKYHY